MYTTPASSSYPSTSYTNTISSRISSKSGEKTYNTLNEVIAKIGIGNCRAAGAIFALWLFSNYKYALLATVAWGVFKNQASIQRAFAQKPVSIEDSYIG